MNAEIRRISMTPKQAEKFKEMAFLKGLPMANMRQVGTPEYCAGYEAASRGLAELFDAIEEGDDATIQRLLRTGI
jgi:hypothetical protein